MKDGLGEITGAGGLLRTVYVGQNGTCLCYTRILPDLEQVVCYTVPRFRACCHYTYPGRVPLPSEC
jgi:hypothetical protein